VPFHPLEHII